MCVIKMYNYDYSYYVQDALQRYLDMHHKMYQHIIIFIYALYIFDGLLEFCFKYDSQYINQSNKRSKK